MDSADVIILCSSQPGLLRCLVSRLGGKYRLLECYSLTEAGQLAQLHQPRIMLADLRNAAGQRLHRCWAVAQHFESMQVVVITGPQELAARQIPAELASRISSVELDASGENWEIVVDVVNDLALPPDTYSSREDDRRGRRGAVSPPGSSSATVRQHQVQLAGQRTAGTEPTQRPHVVTPMADRSLTETPALRSMLERLEVAARHDVTILLIGETGSGKTHLARLIHESSPRRQEPFFTVACGALPGDLIESELFGHAKGAFTSAHADKDGKFLAAGRGTILLDEIDVLTPEQQVKLLRVIEDGQFEPVGCNSTRQVEARIIAASNLELQPLVENGRFRADLYYRLNTLSFQIPPLRNRLPDIEPLARHFVNRHATSHNIRVREISDDFLAALSRYPWPGNVREMENAIRRAVIYCTQGRLTADMLPPDIAAGATIPGDSRGVAGLADNSRGRSLGNRIELTEKQIIEQALLANRFSRTRTASQLGISRVTLYNKMKKYDLMSTS